MASRITLEEVLRYRSMKPRRKRFLDSKVVKEHESGSYVVSPTFMCIDRLFEAETGLRTRYGKFGPFCFLNDQSEIELALQWQSSREELVFLRDALTGSVALDFNLASPGVYTAFGQAEHDAKAAKDEAAIEALADACAALIEELATYRGADAICAVPPSPDKEWDLPSELALRVSQKTGIPALNAQVRFTAPKSSVKALMLEDKWAELEKGGLKVEADLSGKRVILIDDKYQSGTTAQFVGSKLFDAGARQVLGLFCVKTWRDTDNT